MGQCQAYTSSISRSPTLRVRSLTISLDALLCLFLFLSLIRCCTATMTWSSPRASGTPPLRRNAHTATAVPRASPVGEQRCDKDVVAEMLILGGSSDQGPVNLDNMDALQVLAGGSLRWRSVSLTGPTPASREMHSATLFESLGAASQGGDDGEGKEGQRGQQGRSGTVCVFAGRGASAVLNDLCLLDLASLTWAGTVASKVQRCAHAAPKP